MGRASQPAVENTAAAHEAGDAGSPDRLPRAIALALLLITVAGILAHQGTVLNYAFPVATLLAALMLHRSRPIAYLKLTWWVWILAPEVRRFADYYSGFHATSPISLAPFLVAGVSVLDVVEGARRLGPSRPRGFYLIFAGLGVASLTGAAFTGLQTDVFGLVQWLVPPLFALHVAIHWDLYPTYKDTVLRLSVLTVIVISAYAIVQFFLYPGWDHAWALNSGLAEFVDSSAMHFRPFSTLNSPGPFAFVLMMLMFLCFQAKDRLRTIAIVLGVAALTITRVRATWGLFVVGVGLMVLTQRRQAARSVQLVALILIPALALGLSGGPVGTLIADRFKTANNLGQDASFQDRYAFFKQYAPKSVTDPIGRGVGSTSTATRLNNSQGQVASIAAFDSGVLDVPYDLGWVGSILYVWGVIALVRRSGRSPPPADRLLPALQAIGLTGALFQLFDNDLNGVGGFFIFLPLGLALAGRYWNEALDTRSSSPDAHAPREASRDWTWPLAANGTARSRRAGGP